MAVHFEFIADDLDRLTAILGPLSTDQSTVEITGGGDVYISVDLRERAGLDAARCEGCRKPVPEEGDGPDGWSLDGDGCWICPQCKIEDEDGAPEVDAVDVVASPVEADAEPEPDEQPPGEPDGELDGESDNESEVPALSGPVPTTCEEAVMEALQAADGPLHATEVARRVRGGYADGTVSITLGRLAREGKILKPQRAVFEAL